MIPKIVHYCWFGRGTKPELALKCIESWKKYLPDYKLVEWNENTFNIKKAPVYVQEAYKARQFAFVTDYVRLFALYTQGGIYMDTDVEVLKPLDQFLCHAAFSGFEDNNHVPTGIMASEAHGKWVKDQLEYYSPDRHFYTPDGNVDQTTNVKIITEYMLAKGLVLNNTFQDFDGLITLYPSNWFCPKSWSTGKIHITPNTHTIHHFAGSWKKNKPKYKLSFQIRTTGAKLIDKLYLRKIYNKIRGRK